MSRVAIVSFRLGGTDGVSIESAKWIGALRELGHHVSTVAGSGTADQLLAGLAANASSPPSFDELNEALEPFDLVIVENMASLPLNVAAREVLYDVLSGRAALFHHHDFAWQRAHLSHLEGPRDEPGWRHVTINELSRRELHQRGIEATIIYNSFDCSPSRGRREWTRRALRLDDETLVALPTRAIPRKNVEGALALCEELDAVLWLMGPAEDDYGQKLDQLLEASPVTVRRMLPEDVTMDDAYAGADLVVMPSTWEGFGNPVLESVTHRRALALNHYPVALEILSFGFKFFELSDVERLKRFLKDPDEELFDANLEIARRYFNLNDLAGRLRQVLG